MRKKVLNHFIGKSIMIHYPMLKNYILELNSDPYIFFHGWRVKYTIDHKFYEDIDLLYKIEIETQNLNKFLGDENYLKVVFIKTPVVSPPFFERFS